MSKLVGVKSLSSKSELNYKDLLDLEKRSAGALKAEEIADELEYAFLYGAKYAADRGERELRVSEASIYTADDRHVLAAIEILRKKKVFRGISMIMVKNRLNYNEVNFEW